MSFQNDLKEMLSTIENHFTDPQKRFLAARIASDQVELVARAAAGEDIEDEMKHLKAQLLNLTAAEQHFVGNTVFQFLSGMIFRLIAGA